MAATVIIPTTLRMFTGHNSEPELDGSTVGEVITALADEYPETKKVLFGEDGELREFINVFVGADNIRDLQGYDTPVRDGEDKRLAYDSTASYMILSLMDDDPVLDSFHIEGDTATKEELVIE